MVVEQAYPDIRRVRKLIVCSAPVILIVQSLLL